MTGHIVAKTVTKESEDKDFVMFRTLLGSKKDIIYGESPYYPSLPTWARRGHLLEDLLNNHSTRSLDRLLIDGWCTGRRDLFKMELSAINSISDEEDGLAIPWPKDKEQEEAM
jgi:hypothetical protein